MYKNTLDYVEKNGVKSYGIMAIGHSDSMLKLLKDPSVEGISINDIKASVYSK